MTDEQNKNKIKCKNCDKFFTIKYLRYTHATQCHGVKIYDYDTPTREYKHKQQAPEPTPEPTPETPPEPTPEPPQAPPQAPPQKKKIILDDSNFFTYIRPKTRQETATNTEIKKYNNFNII